VIDRNGGWQLVQDLTGTLRSRKPGAVLIAEEWADQSAFVRRSEEGGAGFDAVVDSGLREAIRAAMRQAALGQGATVELDSIARELVPKHGPGWRSVHHLENHDIVRVINDSGREPRIAGLADGVDARSWYAQSRSRGANGLLLTAPGIPMLFMGQEFLDDKFWSDRPDFYAPYVIWWVGLGAPRRPTNGGARASIRPG